MKKNEAGKGEEYKEAEEKEKKFPVKKVLQLLIMVAAMALGGGTVTITQDLLDDSEQAEEHREEEAYIAEKKTYTMLLYMIGSDLESDPDGDWGEESGAASKDMEEIAAAMKKFGLDDSVHVVAQIGGSESWEEKSLGDIQNARLTIDSKGIHVTEELPDTDMGESETLTEFVDYACKTYPAEHYIVVFWNHGSGPVNGYGKDILHDGSSLTLDELNLAFAAAQYQEFELIGFDACYMGNIETVNALCDYTEYMVASPAREDADGWDYSWLEVLGEGTPDKKPGRQIGKQIVDTYGAFYRKQENRGKIATLSCYDMKAYETLQEGIEEYSTALLARSAAEEDFFENLSEIRGQIEGYDFGESMYNIMSLLDFQQVFASIDGEQWEACEMQAALKDFVCCATGISKEMSGISIYLPGAKGLDLAEEIFWYLNCRFDENYLKFIYKYAEMLDDKLEIDLEIIRRRYDKKTHEIQFQIVPELTEQVAEAYIMAAFQAEDGEDFYLLSADSGVQIEENGTITGSLDMKYFTLADQLLCLIEQYASEKSAIYASPIWYRDKICLMTIEVSLENPNGRIVGIAPYGEEYSGKEQYTLKEGESFCPLYPLIRKDGGEILSDNLMEHDFYRGETVVLKSYDCNLKLQEVEFEQCFYGLMVKDATLKMQYSDLRKL